MVKGVSEGSTILAEAKATLGTARVVESLAKFEQTLEVLGPEATRVEGLLITYSSMGRLARGFSVVGEVLYKDGVPYLVRGFKVFVHLAY
jgi:hypothetical protein